MNWYKISQVNFAPFLETEDTAWEWAKENIDISYSEEDIEEDPENYDIKAIVEKYKDQADLYSDKYHQIKNLSAITIYRMIRVKSLDEIKWDELGTHWSFKKDRAGVYGDTPYGLSKKDTIDVLVTAQVEPKFIDWEYGFTSFMYYGTDQWECAIDNDTPLVITEIDDKKIKSIRASA